jgi:hypothetical protein
MKVTSIVALLLAEIVIAAPANDKRQLGGIFGALMEEPGMLGALGSTYIQVNMQRFFADKKF